jgi:PAS domain S-box-containing protein
MIEERTLGKPNTVPGRREVLPCCAEKKPEERAELLGAIIDNSSRIIYLKDRQGRYLLVNRQYEQLFHLTCQQIVGKTDYDIFPRETADAFRANDLKVLDAGGPFEV